MNKPLDPDNDTVDLNETVMESAASPIAPPVPEVAAMGWDEPVGSAGSRTRMPPDSDPEGIAQQLVEAGNEEAGLEQRQAADDPAPLT